MPYLPRGLEVGEHRDLRADAGEVVERQPDPGGMGDGQEVEHGVGRAAEGDDHGDGVLERLPRQDVAGADPGLEQLSAAAPARRQSARFSAPTRRAGRSCSAGDMPSASMAEAMVLAVYMPPQEPGPGMAQASTSASPASSSRAGGVLADGLEDRDDVALLASSRDGCRAGSCRRRRRRPGGSAGPAP